MSDILSTSNGSESPPPARTTVSNRLDFSASLESFQGPLDLLLYLIKENEIEITDIPISAILDQYLRFLDQAVQWDLQLAGEFLVMAATLMEIKSRELLPVQEQPLDGEDLIEDPRSELVRQLLQYRRLKDQARALDQLQTAWQRCRPRGLFNDIPDDPESSENNAAAVREALVDVDLYALFSAYERILKSVLAQSPSNLIYEGESIEAKITRIEGILKSRPFAHFAELIADIANRADVAATFVALLELVRRRAVRLIQQHDYGSIGVKVHQEGEAEVLSKEEASAAETAAADAIKARAQQEAVAQAVADPSGKLPWMKRRVAKLKFEGILRPEDVEELDAEESEIARRIDLILEAADAISERFEQSREGRMRTDPANPDAQLQGPPASLSTA